MSDGVHKCETARHDEMPEGCLNSRHQHCQDCGRCYTCAAEASVAGLRQQEMGITS